jgi:hypothetical protein
MSEMKLKVSEKGGVSLYGLGRFPVTLYKGQWESFLERSTTFGSSSRRTLTSLL